MDCSSCSYSEVMPDGSLFCAIYEQQTHGNENCPSWSNENVFIEFNGSKRIDKENY